MISVKIWFPEKRACPAVDMVMVIDTSYSVEGVEQTQTRDFIRDTTAFMDIGPNGYQLCLISYSNVAEVTATFAQVGDLAQWTQNICIT